MNHEAKEIVSILMKNLKSKKLSKIGVDEVRAAIKEYGRKVDLSRFDSDKFEEKVFRVLVSSV